MSNLQVKNIPEELHAAISARAKAEHLTMSQYVTRVLAREVSRPRIDVWLADWERADLPAVDVDVVALLDDVRSDDPAPR
ncbi:hypothetical protein G4X40_21155 [Rhodococcus sp. D2-41]|uniref:Type II toxin-antitoxin system HicB family antitoxin n=1 Tax=Speluncibacter jeojiensis TaxID=2710754 RepID=A0A9X4M1S0_9ACTN|nr:hypothetical protein [Rhodococcus sp. D2-41]MDG3012653.1 hypothetical protein [Rhodococcus sp. D2-41]MDG3015242.1 type II toxin-antitoxin system HicB family antitoxin [Corynebacteriales bacterium D3-21]